MKVALLNHEGGGISSVCYNLAHSLSRRKIETTVFSTTTNRKVQVEKINDYLEVIRLPILNYPPRLLWFHLRRSGMLLKLLEDYTLIHGVSPDIAFSYTFSKKHSKKPLITTLHYSYKAALKAFINTPISVQGHWAFNDFAFHVLELPLHEMTIRRCFSKSDRLVVCAHTTLNELKMYNKFDISKVSVIYNGINFHEIQEAEIRDDERDSDHELSMMYASRLFAYKGIMFALKAYENLKTQFTGLHLKIFGKGPLEKKIRSFIACRKLENDVSFGGFLPSHKDLIREIKKSDVVVFPSLYEAQPMFALEAMACKKPLVVFDLPYAREIIVDGHNGLLAKTYDVEDLSNKIALVLQDRKLRLKIGENAYGYVKETHDWDKQAEKYLKVYREVTTSD